MLIETFQPEPLHGKLRCGPGRERAPVSARPRDKVEVHIARRLS